MPSLHLKETTMTKQSEAKNQPKRETKISKVIGLLKRADGATLDEIVKATGWQAHTSRATLTGLKKKGEVIQRDKRGDVTCYRIIESA